MKLMDVLRVCDFSGLYVICYIEEEDEPAWDGTPLDIPYWIADCELNTNNGYGEPIDYRIDLGENYNHKPGLVVCLKDKEV